MNDGDDRLSDEATGLPPLEQLEPSDAVLLLAWDASVGIVVSPFTNEDLPVRVLHVRGLSQGLGTEGEKSPDWVQCFICVPTIHAVDVAAALAKGSTEELGDEDIAASTEAFVLEKLWTDSLENEVGSASGYTPCGVAFSEAEAKHIVAEAGERIGTGWPFMQGEKVPNMRYVKVPVHG